MSKNKSLQGVTDSIVQWHHDVGIMEHTTDQKQCFKMHEEMIELFCACHPGYTKSQLWREFNANTARLYDRDKFKPVSPENAEAAKIDAVGDMVTVGLSILERAKSSLRMCLNGVYAIISARTAGGKIVDGSFVKKEDLPYV